MKAWEWILVALVTGFIGYLVIGHWAGGLAAIVAFLPAGRRLLTTQQAAGQREQAQQDQQAAQRERDTLQEKLTAIDAKTAEQVSAIEKQPSVEQPSKEQLDEMLARFTPRGPQS